MKGKLKCYLSEAINLLKQEQREEFLKIYNFIEQNLNTKYGIAVRDAIIAAVDYAKDHKDPMRPDASEYLAEAIYAIEADDPNIEIYLDNI